MLPTTNLDNLTYQQLIEILRAHLPGTEWSDHNPSDPGIALIELLSWLGEMNLYRMNRVPASHRDKFLKLLVDPPVPVTVMVTLGLTPTRLAPLVVPPGLRVASDYRNGRRTVLENEAPVTLVPGPTQVGTVRMRAVRDLLDLPLGLSDGRPNQTFTIPDGPVLLDFASVTPTYNPNPRVRVGAVEWELHPFLLTAASRANPTPPNHFMVEDFEGRVRFGDDVFGAIPPAGSAITLIRAQVLDGPDALIGASDVPDTLHVLNPEIVPGLAPDNLKAVANADAQGGENFFSLEERMRRGLEEFRNPTRLITAPDFERVTTEDFNEYQARFNAALGAPGATDLIARATALMNRRPPSLAVGAPGHVTLMVLPVYDETAFDAAALGPAATPGTKLNLVTPAKALADRLLAFLEPRRLLTTRLHVIGPELKELSAQVVVVQQPQSDAAQLARAVEAALRQYLSITRGYDDGRGWPLGRPIRRSQLYQLLEALPGVDYVASLTLSPANTLGDVELGPRELPVWGLGTALDIQVQRL